MNIQELIGDYQSFFSDLLHRLRTVNIDTTDIPMLQLLYRTSTILEYEVLRDQLKVFCSEFVETQFNGRAVAIHILKESLVLEGGFSTSMIELTAPRSIHMYPSGLESIGLFVGKSLAKFKEHYKNVLTGVKEHGQYCQPAFITFENEKTVKFYDYTLRDIILLQGWTFEQLGD